MRWSEDRTWHLVTFTGNPCQSTGTSSPVSTGDLPVLPVQVINGPDWFSEFLIQVGSGPALGSGLTLILVLDLLFPRIWSCIL